MGEGKGKRGRGRGRNKGGGRGRGRLKSGPQPHGEADGPGGDVVNASSISGLGSGALSVAGPSSHAGGSETTAANSISFAGSSVDTNIVAPSEMAASSSSDAIRIPSPTSAAGSRKRTGKSLGKRNSDLASNPASTRTKSPGKGNNRDHELEQQQRNSISVSATSIDTSSHNRNSGEVAPTSAHPITTAIKLESRFTSETQAETRGANARRVDAIADILARGYEGRALDVVFKNWEEGEKGMETEAEETETETEVEKRKGGGKRAKKGKLD